MGAMTINFLYFFPVMAPQWIINNLEEKYLEFFSEKPNYAMIVDSEYYCLAPYEVNGMQIDFDTHPRNCKMEYYHYIHEQMEINGQLHQLVEISEELFVFDEDFDQTLQKFADYSDFSTNNPQKLVLFQAKTEEEYTSEHSSLWALAFIPIGVILLGVLIFCIVRRRQNSSREVEMYEQPRKKKQDKIRYSLENSTIKATEKIEQGQEYDDEANCAVCLGKGCNCYLPCKHFFHHTCIKSWLGRKSKCPLCQTTYKLKDVRVIKKMEIVW